MTGGEALISDKVGEDFSAWDGYISGSNIELKPNEKIVQKWRTSEFDDSEESSDLVIELTDLPNGHCQLNLTHSNLKPGDDDKYKQGWIDHYFLPMREYFS